ncbi:Gfo/Idh/MocA family oxidoreductase [Aquimarina sp. 2201CG5-10]|uniref:Gfo/Idh/MocA family oxidoreductase n=1 Tax=Aquimarina callyspongiae TaxID=3098150 RepID=UPI002AB4395D|nr:Gfo/Idh/MocA family oxidoreductase [Aquimarina sp. 2201CG5-10]MDY8136897.1 Gfo/Idh/MocA family oxidoreductase [Aquimarina sp. 2201CG5-10]
MNKNFAMIGAAGYVAPKHLQAIKKTNNNLLAALDKFDSVGVLDSYFPEANFFVEFERFDRHLEKMKRRKGIPIDYVSICTPNYLHDAHIRMALRRGAHAICEKPLVLNPWNIQSLIEIEQESGKTVNTILQLRLHHSIIALKKMIENGPKDKIYDIELTYLTSRGNWYNNSWKGEIAKSGGIATNIGIHFFDMLLWIFGGVTENIVHKHDPYNASGYLELERARVKWFLSIDYNNIPESVKLKNQRTYRSIQVDGEEIEFSSGFTELHTKSYQKILEGNGFGLRHAKPAVQLVHDIRNAEISPLRGDYHPLLNKLNGVKEYSGV